MALNVQCDNCSTGYTFDENRVPPEGVSVKCSHCGYVFKVMRDGAQAGGAGAEWRVRTKAGSQYEFKELTTLQRWIVERKVSRDDEISKTGRNWKKLGDIAELAAFFQVVDQASTPKAKPVDPSQLGGAFPSSPRAGGWEAAASAGQSGPHAIGAVSEHAFDEDDDYRKMKRKKGGGAGWVILVVLIALGGGGVIVWTKKPELLEPLLGDLVAPRIPELAQQHVVSGRAELRKDSNAGIAAAKDNFEKALALYESYAEARALLAEAELARAENLSVQASEQQLAAAAATDAAQKAPLEAKIEELRQESDALADKAFNYAKDALKVQPTALVTNRAMADYYRFKGANAQMQKLIDTAKAAGAEDPGVAYVLGSAIAGDAASSERAMRYFDQALEKAPDMQRARWKLAQLWLAAGNADKAKMHTQMILDAVPDHERAKALMLRINPPPVVAKAPEPPPPPVAEKPSFGKLIAQADRLRSQDKAQQALKLYEQALELEPDDLDAQTGMGFCYVDLENPDAAIVMFKKVLENAPRFTDAHMGMGEAYRMKGMKRDAVKHFRAYLDILPDGPDAEVAKRMLETLQ
jgi:predicted Zn finger-like uncharacterized protein